MRFRPLFGSVDHFIVNLLHLVGVREKGIHDIGVEVLASASADDVIAVFQRHGLPVAAVAGNGERYLGFSGGYSFVRAMDFMISFEKETRYHGSHELFAEFYNSKEHGSWEYLREYRGGYAYKFPLYRGKNTTFRMRGGAALGSDEEGFTAGFQLGFEFNYTFLVGSQLFLQQKNEYCILTPRPWRSGLMVGLRFPF